MGRKRLLVAAVVLIGVGIGGLIITNWIAGPDIFSNGLISRGGMMSMMRGGGMMNQKQMKGMMQEMMSGRLPPGIKPEGLPDPDSLGAEWLNRYCAQCHNLPHPSMHTAEEWPVVEERMFARMQMMGGMRGMMRRGMMRVDVPSNREKQTLLAYLQQHGLKPASLESLGPSQTPGLEIFRSSCSQCHALPDPKLHTAEEWPRVVERMQKNMDIMGKPVITNQERDEIISYLRMKTENND